MPTQWYQAASTAMSYFFTLLAVMIVYRSARWLISDERIRARALDALPDAGFIGHFVVLAGESRSLEPGDELSIPCEGTFGYSKRCDVYVRHRSLNAKEAYFWLDKDGLHMAPMYANSFIVDGEAVNAGDEAVMRNGAKVFVGEVQLQLKLLKGIHFEDAIEPYVTPERRKRARKQKEKEAEPKPEKVLTVSDNTQGLRASRRKKKQPEPEKAVKTTVRKAPKEKGEPTPVQEKPKKTVAVPAKKAAKPQRAKDAGRRAANAQSEPSPRRTRHEFYMETVEPDDPPQKKPAKPRAKRSTAAAQTRASQGNSGKVRR